MMDIIGNDPNVETLMSSVAAQRTQRIGELGAHLHPPQAPRGSTP